MITLKKLSGERFLLNHHQIEAIEMIPETKVIMMNHDYYLVRDTVEEVVEKIGQYTAKIQDIYRQISINDNRQ